MREPIDSIIARLALVLDMPSRDARAVLNEAIRRIVNADYIQQVKRVGTVIGTCHRDMNERDIARIDQTRTIRKGDKYNCRGRVVTATKDWSKTTRGFRVQFKHLGTWHRKFFSDSKHNGPFGARAAARAWRDQTERKIGRNVVTQKVTFKTYNAEDRKR